MLHPSSYLQLFRTTNGDLELAYRRVQKEIVQRRHWEPPYLGGIVL